MNNIFHVLKLVKRVEKGDFVGFAYINFIRMIIALLEGIEIGNS